jgi:hypothetical protein
MRQGVDALSRANTYDKQLADLPSVESSIKPLQDQRAAAATPLNPADYKPSFGQRLVRGLQGFARGGVFGAVDPTIGGAQAYGAPTRQFGIDTALQAQRVGGIDQSIEQARKNYQDTSSRIKANAQEARSTATAIKDVGAAYKDVNTPQKEGNPEQQAFDSLVKGGMAPSDAFAKVKQAANVKDPTIQQQYLDALTSGDAAKMAAIEKTIRATRTDPQVQVINAAADRRTAGKPNPNATGDTSLSGEEYLKTLDPKRASLIKEIGEGRGAPPNSRSKDGMALMADVTQAYPDYDASKFPAYSKMRQDMTSGKTGAAINSFNTALRHLDRLEKNIPDNTSLPAANWIINLGRRASGSGALKPFESDALAVSNEVEKAYKGGALSEGDYNHMRSLLNENDSPKALKASIKEFRELLHGKLESFREQELSARPSGSVQPITSIHGKDAEPKPGGFNWDAHPEAK